MAERQEFVAALLRKGTSNSTIAAACKAEFGMAPRTVDDYVRRVRRQWQADAAERAPSQRAATLARLYDELAELRKAKAYSAMVSLEKLVIDVEGSRAPAQAQVQLQASITDDISNMSLEECLREHEAFERALERAKKGGHLQLVEDNAIDVRSGASS